MKEHVKKHVHRLRHAPLTERLIAKFVGHKKAILLGVGILLFLVILMQLLYPGDKTLPFARIGGQAVGGQSKDAIALELQNSFATYEVEFRAAGKSETRLVSELGGTMESDDMLERAVDYPLVYRLVPFSLLWYRTMPSEYVVSYSQSILEREAKLIAKELSVNAVDASIAIDEQGKTKITESQDGSKVTPEIIMDKTQSVALSIADDRTSLSIDPEVDRPRVSDDDVSSLEQTIESILDQTITINIAGDDMVEPSRSDIAAWVDITRSNDESIKLSPDAKAITYYIDNLNKQYITPPTATVVKLIDGVEQSRKVGRAGQGLARDELANNLADVITQPVTDGPRTINASYEPIEPPIKRDATYTSSQAGLTAYVADMTRDGSIKISVRQLGADGWSAEGAASDSITSASTYKPYVFLRVFDDIKSGKLKWNDKIDGVTYSKCLEDAIVISANECVMAVIEKYGGQSLTDYLRGRGFSAGTGFVFSEVTQTTASDLTRLMAGIENGSLVSGDNRDRLLDAMGRQVYRQGIPAGTSAPVYDKVGFLWDYLHDAAIVRHPDGTYVLSIMTKGESWAKIAEITRKIESILYG